MTSHILRIKYHKYIHIYIDTNTVCFRSIHRHVTFPKASFNIVFQHNPSIIYHDDVIKWKHFPRYWPFVLGIHRSPVNFPHKGQWHGTLMFSLICGRINGWVNNGEAGNLRRHRVHYDVIVMTNINLPWSCFSKPGPRFIHVRSTNIV